jgi:hypothetical protein
MLNAMLFGGNREQRGSVAWLSLILDQRWACRRVNKAGSVLGVSAKMQPGQRLAC